MMNEDKNEITIIDEESMKRDISDALLGMAYDESLRVRDNLSSLGKLENEAVRIAFEKMSYGEINIHELLKVISTMNTSVNRSISVMKNVTEMNDILNVFIGSSFTQNNNNVNITENSELDKNSREKIRKLLSAINVMEDDNNEE